MTWWARALLWLVGILGVLGTILTLGKWRLDSRATDLLVKKLELEHQRRLRASAIRAQHEEELIEAADRARADAKEHGKRVLELEEQIDAVEKDLAQPRPDGERADVFNRWWRERAARRRAHDPEGP